MRKLSIFLLSGLLLCLFAACRAIREIPPSDAAAAHYRTDHCEVGDIILRDGTVLKPEALTSIISHNPPVAVAAILQEDGTAVGVGVHISDRCLPWAMSTADGHSTAFSFADDYAETYETVGGWRMPDIEELSAIYANRDAVNASLRDIYELDSNAAVDGLGTNWYWASTPSDTEDGFAWFVHYFNGYAACCPTDLDNLHAMAVRDFAEAG